jgi:hypothetical protein
MQPAKNDRIPKEIWQLGAIYLAQGIVGFAALFFWAYAIWILLKQDRLLDAAAACIVAPIGAIYGFLRFFGWL